MHTHILHARSRTTTILYKYVFVQNAANTFPAPAGSLLEAQEACRVYI